VTVIGDLLILVLQVFQLVLLARVLISWFPNIDRSNQIVQLLFDVTEPILQPIRNMLPPTGMMDFSPLIVFLAISVLLQLIPRIF
jgi:YggT family protein